MTYRRYNGNCVWWFRSYKLTKVSIPIVKTICEGATWTHTYYKYCWHIDNRNNENKIAENKNSKYNSLLAKVMVFTGSSPVGLNMPFTDLK